MRLIFSFIYIVGSRNRSTPGPQRYICRVCGDQLGKERIFRRHVLIHSSLRHLNPHSSCGVCILPPSQCVRASKFLLRCHVCGQRFNRKQEHYQHVQKNHCNDRRLQCNVCPEYFDGMQELTKHRNTHEQGNSSESEEDNSSYQVLCCSCKNEVGDNKNGSVVGNVKIRKSKKSKCQRCSKVLALENNENGFWMKTCRKKR